MSGLRRSASPSPAWSTRRPPACSPPTASTPSCTTSISRRGHARDSAAPASSRTTPARLSSARSPTAARAAPRTPCSSCSAPGSAQPPSLDGRVVRGPRGHGAILGGHITVDLDGPRCPCGNIGCAEALASTWALTADAAAGRLDLGPELAARLADQGALGIRDLVETRDERESAIILDRYIRTWAAVIVTQCHAFDPDIVVVTGGVMRAADVILPALRERVHADLWSSSLRPPFVTPDDPSTSVLRGLAALADDLDSKGRP